MNCYESVVIDYLRADRAAFVNTEYCIQLSENENPDVSGPHWYCDAVTCNFRVRTVFLCEISYSRQLSALGKRLRAWHDNWEMVCRALKRDSLFPTDWDVRPWLFIPESLVPVLLKKLSQLSGGANGPSFSPVITPLEMTQPWRYRSWNRVGEAAKPESVPPYLTI